MHVVTETNRLLVRLFTINDAQLIYDLNSDPGVTRYTYDHIKDLIHARRVLEQTILPSRYRAILKMRYWEIGKS
jgi:hypothetical protein